MALALQGFLEFKRRRGYQYNRAELTLRHFDRFLAARVRQDPSWLLDEAILAWLAGRPKRQAISVSLEMAVIRQFWFYVRRHHPQRCRREIRWPKLPTEPKPFVAHVLTADNVRLLLRLASKLKSPPFRSALYRTLLLVLYCTGLRFGEALRLRICDVDLRRKVIFIDESKGRARWVPFHSSLRDELIRYLRVRREFAVARPGDRFFVGVNNKTQLLHRTACQTICGLYRKAGLKPPRGRIGPRPYDLRHTFAVHRLTRWYHEGVDLHAHLPWLSAYMGHVNLLGTETYLTATPELLSLAAHRFHRRFARRSRQ